MTSVRSSRDSLDKFRHRPFISKRENNQKQMFIKEMMSGYSYVMLNKS